MDCEKKTRILCVDDHLEIRRLFELILRGHADLETVGTLGGAEGLEEAIAKLQPDVVVLDVSMPGRDPFEAMKAAKAQFPRLEFLVSSAFDDQPLIEEALNAGATGYLVKDGAFDALAHAIRQVARGERVVPGSRLGSFASRSEQFTCDVLG